MSIEKFGIKLPISAEMFMPNRFPRIASQTPIPPTAEERKAYKKWKRRTKKLIDEGRDKGWWSDGSGYDESWSFQKPAPTYEVEYERDENGEIVYVDTGRDSLIPNLDQLNADLLGTVIDGSDGPYPDIQITYAFNRDGDDHGSDD